MEFGSAGKKTQTETALQIDVLMEDLCKKKPVLLLVDEAQELAKTREHEAVATALRTAIIKNQARLRVVFTGSSRTQLAHVFSNSQASLYSTGAAIGDFPQLGLDFVEYIAEKFKASTKRTLPIKPAWQAFVRLKQQPETFLMAMVDMVLNPTRLIEDAIEKVEAKLSHTENHEGVWSAFDATQQALVRMLAKDALLKPFSQATLAKLRKITGNDSLKITHIQRAMSSLSTVVVKSPRDTYEFDNEAFAQWVRSLAESR